MLIALDMIPTRNRDINVVKYFPNLKKKKKSISLLIFTHFENLSFRTCLLLRNHT